MYCAICGISGHFGRKLIDAEGKTMCSACFLNFIISASLKDNEYARALSEYIRSDADAGEWFYEYYK